MKKVLLSLICVVLLCGCSNDNNKYSEFEHYDLTNYNHQIFSYVENFDEWSVDEYSVSELTKKDETNEMGIEEGILYKVGEDDYILLDSFPGEETYDNKEYTLLYNNKIYILRGGVLSEYTLKKEHTEKKFLEFDMSDVIKAETIMLHFYGIEKIDDDYIYLRGSVSGYNGSKPVADIRDIHLKCSLSDYKCIEIE